MKFFISDTHFFHKNILKYQPNRKFSSVEDMNKTLIKNWNSVIKKRDEVYILGDFSFGDEDETIGILKELNGTKYLIKGNHDCVISSPKVAKEFAWIKDYFVLKHHKRKIILFHFPIYSWDSKYHGSIHLYGHSHDKEKLFNEPNSFNVGVDVNNLLPISLNDILLKFPAENK